MKKILFLLLPVAYFNSCFAQNPTYPIAPKTPVIDEFYKKYKVIDNYRWMEDQNSPELKKWVNEENAISDKFITRASNKNDAMQFITRLSNVDYHDPIKKGNYYFTYAYYDGISMPALFVQNSLADDEPRVLIDPNFISHKDKIVIRDFEVSGNSKYIAYEYSRNGSDWVEINVSEIEGPSLTDHLTNVKFSSIAWHGNGFFYSAYPRVTDLGRTQGQTILYHKLGSPQSDDAVAFKRDNPTIQFNFLTTNDERYFILAEHNPATYTYSYYFIDYNDPEPSLKPLLINLKYSIDIIDSHNGKFIAKSFHNADKGSIVEIDPQNPLKWKAIAASYSEALLLNVVPLKDKIIAVYKSKFTPVIVAIDYNGKQLNSMSFPVGTSVRGFTGSPNDTELLYSFQSYTTPPVVYTLNTETFENKITRISSVNYDYKSFVYKELAYNTNDSVKVPMMLVYKKDIKLDGNNPVLLETYGGFGAISEPHFDPGLIYFLNKGGVYAYAYVRGGGELGSKWTSAGKGVNKQNSFSDFIAGAEYLIKEGYTSPSKLAISGGSNGGLVVAVVAIQRPDLFKAVIPVVAPLDMLRFENFTIGSFHTNEYGTVKDSTSFARLYNYSPYNNIKENVNYPAMLIITSENDDRVPPLHSFKFAAKLQSRPAQINPILLMVNKQAGHYGIGDNSFIADLREKANLYAFVVEMLK
jgi:prolyl oligopeptidase